MSNVSSFANRTKISIYFLNILDLFQDKAANRIKFIKQGWIKCTMDGEVTRELKAIRKDLEYIKAHMVDVDMLLTPSEEKLLEQGVAEFESGKTVKLEDFERE